MEQEREQLVRLAAEAAAHAAAAAQAAAEAAAVAVTLSSSRSSSGELQAAAESLDSPSPSSSQLSAPPGPAALPAALATPLPASPISPLSLAGKWESFEQLGFVEAVNRALQFQREAMKPERSPSDDDRRYLEISIDGLQRALENFQPQVAPELQFPSGALSPDEVAAIRLYTNAEAYFYFYLNRALRKSDEAVLEPWKPLTRLLLSGLTKLPRKTYPWLWRGVNRDLRRYYPDRARFMELVSASTDASYINANVASEEPPVWTLLRIENAEAVNIKSFSFKPDENEVVLWPGTPFTIVNAICVDVRPDQQLVIMTVAVEGQQLSAVPPVTSLDLRTFQTLGSYLDAATFWREDNNFQDDVPVRTLLSALQLFAMRRNMLHKNSTPLDQNQKLYFKFAGPERRTTVGLPDFASFLQGHRSLRDALKEYAEQRQPPGSITDAVTMRKRIEAELEALENIEANLHNLPVAVRQSLAVLPNLRSLGLCWMPYKSRFQEGAVIVEKDCHYVDYSAGYITEVNNLELQSTPDAWHFRIPIYQLHLTFCRVLNELKPPVHPWLAELLKIGVGADGKPDRSSLTVYAYNPFPPLSESLYGQLQEMARTPELYRPRDDALALLRDQSIKNAKRDLHKRLVELLQ